MEDIESLKKELEYYKKIFGISEFDPVLKGYKAYLKIINEQIEHLNNFSIVKNIEGKKSENALYERTESMWSDLPNRISSLNKLKLELNIEYDENEGKLKKIAISPQSIGKMY